MPYSPVRIYIFLLIVIMFLADVRISVINSVRNKGGMLNENQGIYCVQANQE